MPTSGELIFLPPNSLMTLLSHYFFDVFERTNSIGTHFSAASFVAGGSLFPTGIVSFPVTSPFDEHVVYVSPHF